MPLSCRSVLSLVALGFALLAPTTARGESFKSAVPLSVSGPPAIVMASADFNGDGATDLAYLDGQVNIVLNTGGNQFQKTSFAGPGFFLSLIGVADTDNDQKMDLLLAGADGIQGVVAVYRGNGDGTFQPPIISNLATTSSFPAFRSLVFGDLNADHKLDALLGDSNSDKVDVLIGGGDGHFTLLSELQQFGANQLIASDVNGDGKLDFFALDFLGATIRLFLGNGNGTFQAPALQPFPKPVRGAVLEDATGDGKKDLIALGDLGEVMILAGQANGSFQLVLQTPQGTAGASGVVASAADLNSDGKLDIITVSRNGIVVLSGIGNLSFAPAVIYPMPFFNGLPKPLLADFNGDGHLDFAWPGTQDAPIIFLFGKGSGKFQSADAYDVGARVNSAVLADANRDGKPDILVGTDRPRVGVLLGAGGGLFAIQPQPQSLPTTGSVGSIDAADFNGDSHIDVIASRLNPFIQFGNGNGTFQSPTPAPAATNSVQHLFAAQLDADNAADIVELGVEDLTIFSGNGNGTFKPGVNHAIGFAPRSGVAADFNHDGMPDLAIANVGSSNVSVLLGSMAGFLPATNLPVPIGASDVAVSDLNNDGELDLILAQNGASSVAILFGNGDGTFQPSVSRMTNTPGRQVATGDFNGDGNADIVISGPALIRVMHGNGNGTFDVGRQYVAGNTPGKPIAEDLNGDGTPDLIVPNIDDNGTSTVTVLLNLGGTKTSLTSSRTGEFPFGQSVTLEATVAESVSDAGTPTGSVTFKANGIPLATVPLINGKAQLTTQEIPRGVQHLSATYSGDDVFSGRTFGDIRLQVFGRPTSVAASVSLNPSTAGDPVSLTITVSSPLGVPTGTVELHDSGNFIASTQLTAGTAQFDTLPLTTGLHIFSIRYLGTPAFIESNTELFQVANVSGTSATTTALALSSNSNAPVTPIHVQHHFFRDTMTLTATVNPTSVAGSITFYDGTLPMSLPVPLVGGHATVTVPGFNVGVHRIRAVYSGDVITSGGSVSSEVTLLRSPRPR